MTAWCITKAPTSITTACAMRLRKVLTSMFQLCLLLTCFAKTVHRCFSPSRNAWQDGFVASYEHYCTDSALKFPAYTTITSAFSTSITHTTTAKTTATREIVVVTPVTERVVEDAYHHVLSEKIISGGIEAAGVPAIGVSVAILAGLIGVFAL